MTGVRNGPIARRIATSTGTTTIGTCPTNFTWLLKTVHLLNVGGAAASVVLALSQAGGGVQASLGRFELAAGEAQSWYGWTTLGPGDAIYVNVDQVPIHVWCSGAELPGVIP